ncbi:MAG: NAD(P)-binding protein, partial [Sulfolobus sp.]|nr:NAD(P)-binding protein [Sulfolobus sp.]
MIIMKKILILGAGVGGLTTANRLSSNLSNEIRKGDIKITLLDKREYHFYYPEQIFVAFGL